MRRLLAVAVLLAGMAAPTPSYGATRAQPLDWTLIVITAGPHGASDVHYKFRLMSQAIGSGPGRFFGWLQSDYEPQRQDHPSVSCGLVAPRSSGGPGGQGGTADDSIGDLGPGGRWADLMFFVHGRMERSQIRASAKSGRISVATAVGSGARAIEFGKEPVKRQDAIRTVPTGLAGAFISPNLTAAGTAAWTAPDGSSGSYFDGGRPAGGCRSDAGPAFAGGPGRWKWSWTSYGTDVSGHGLLAWAPIGRYWPVFRLS